MTESSSSRIAHLAGLIVVAFVSPVLAQPANTPQAPAVFSRLPPTPPDGSGSDPAWLHDRGPGTPTSMFGTYVRRGEWLIYPFFEHYRDQNIEYKPSELGYTGDTDFRGRYRAHEALVFVAYGVTGDLAVEFEAAGIHASIEKSPGDVSPMPMRLEESGLGDVEGQIRWRWKRETASRPEFFSYAEAVVPHAASKVLIGTPNWEFKAGTGLIRGFGWGTMTVRAAVEYDAGSSSRFDVGEYAVEYVKRLNPRWRIYTGLEGQQDELSLIAEAQWHFARHAFLRMNNGWGLTSKTTDWSPEIGVVVALPTARTAR
jgi:hypothetical protein